ncbi:MAG: efflux RND transporter periplasmic adaptor subunit [Acidimicrobiales bacterium]
MTLRRKTVLGNGLLLVVVAALAALGLETVFHQASAQSAPRLATAQLGTVTSSVTASGNVTPVQSQGVDFATSGTVTAVNVAVGQTVQAGQALATLNPSTAQATLQAAQDQLAAAQDTLALAQSGGETPPQQAVDANTIATAGAQVAAAQQTLATDTQNGQANVDAAQAKLVSDQSACAAKPGAPSCNSLTGDQAALAGAEQSLASAEQKDQVALNSAQNTLNGDQLSIAAKQYVNPATIAQDQAAVIQAQTTVTTDQQALADTTLTAPFAGTVTALNGSVGQTVAGSGSASTSAAKSSSTGTAASGGSGAAASGAGAAASGAAASGASGAAATSGSSTASSSSSPFLTLASMNALQVVAGFPEADVAELALHQPASVTLSALPATSASGSVTAIDPTPTVVSNVVTYDVTISLVNPPASVKSGMTASVAVTVASRTGVLELPSAAITTTGRRSTVTVLSGGKQVVRPVTIGLVGDTTTQILSGLSAGQAVVLPSATVSSGLTGGNGIVRPGTAGGGGFGGGGLGGAGLGGAGRVVRGGAG